MFEKYHKMNKCSPFFILVLSLVSVLSSCSSVEPGVSFVLTRQERTLRESDGQLVEWPEGEKSVSLQLSMSDRKAGLLLRRMHKLEQLENDWLRHWLVDTEWPVDPPESTYCLEGRDASGQTLISRRLHYVHPFALEYELGDWGDNNPTGKPKSRYVTLEVAPYLSAEDERRITELLSLDQLELDRTVLPRLRRLAVEGDPEALEALGNRYAQGRGVTQNRAEAIRCYRRATEASCGFGERRQPELGE